MIAGSESPDFRNWIGRVVWLLVVAVLSLAGCDAIPSAGLTAGATVTSALIPTSNVQQTSMPVSATLSPTSMLLPEGALRRLDCGAGLYDLAFSPNGRLLAAASREGIFICDTQTNILQRTLVADNATTGGAEWSPDGKQLASGTDQGQVVIWDMTTGAQKAAFKVSSSEVHSVGWSPDAKRVVTTLAGDLHVWDVATGTEITNIKGFGDGSALEWSSTGNWIAFGCTCNEIYVWDVTSKKLVAKLGASLAPVLAMSPDGSRVATQLEKGPVRIYALPSGKELVTPTEYPRQLSSLAWSWDGKWLAGGDWDGAVQVWDTTTGSELAHFIVIDSNVVWSVAWSTDEQLLASLGGDTILLWDVRKLIGK